MSHSRRAATPLAAAVAAKPIGVLRVCRHGESSRIWLPAELSMLAVNTLAA